MSRFRSSFDGDNVSVRVSWARLFLASVILMGVWLFPFSSRAQLSPGPPSTSTYCSNAGGTAWIPCLPPSGGGGSVTQGTSPWVDNISQFGGVSVSLGLKASASSIPVVDATLGSSSFSGSGATQPTNGLLFGGTYQTTQPSASAGSSYPIQLDKKARVITVPGQVTPAACGGSTSLTANTAVSVIVAGSIITGGYVVNPSTNTGNIFVNSAGTATTTGGGTNEVVTPGSKWTAAGSLTTAVSVISATTQTINCVQY